jgi:hypothetical protein
MAHSSRLIAKSIELNAQSLSFAELYQFDPRIQIRYCLDAGTGFVLYS